MLPTLRDRKRYLAFKIISRGRITNVEALKRAIFTAFTDLHGSIAAGEAGIIMLENHFSNNKGILRVNHTHTDQLKSAMAFVTDVGDQEVIMATVGISGILKKALSKYIAG